jgi:virulence-associated protein VagC
MQTTVFKNGGSQAIRIPAQYRFHGETVDVQWDERLGALLVRDEPTHAMSSFFAWLDGQPEFLLPKTIPVTSDGRLDLVAFMELGEELDEAAE